MNSTLSQELVDKDATGELTVKAVVIYDEFPFIAKAVAALRRVGRQPDVVAQWSVKSWPASDLDHAAIAAKALVEAADAHLIVIPTRLTHLLPPRLRDWLERWADRRQIQDAAVAVFGEGMNGHFQRMVSLDLTLLIRKHGLNLITNEDPVVEKATKLVVRFAPERELPLLIEGSRFAHAHTPVSLRCFGINE